MTSALARILALSLLLSSAPASAEGIFTTIAQKCVAALIGKSASIEVGTPEELNTMFSANGEKTVATQSLSVSELQEISNIRFNEKMQDDHSLLPNLRKNNEEISKRLGKAKMLQVLLFGIHSTTLAPAAIALGPSLARGFGTDPVWTSALFFLGVEVIAGSIQLLTQAGINPKAMEILAKAVFFPFYNNRLKLSYLSALATQSNQYRVEKFSVFVPEKRKEFSTQGLIEDLRWQKELAKNDTFRPLLFEDKRVTKSYNMYIIVDTRGAEPVINVVLTTPEAVVD